MIMHNTMPQDKESMDLHNVKVGNAPFYIKDLSLLREKLARAERDGTRMGHVWTTVRRRAQAAPENYPWFTPFVALITGNDNDIEAARQAIRRYVATLESNSYGMGVHFHFWCFAFPHARWTLYFQWLNSIGAWEKSEAATLREELLSYQYLYFFSGMRMKPEPECVDNQTMSLCYSNALIGTLFGTGDDASPMAQRMLTDGLRRLPEMLGGFPPSGYSGEGSTYMDYVVGPSIPFVVELLERICGGDWFSKSLPPHGGSAEAVVRMIAREWMPSGLLLPWDHYGYALPTRSCLAYGASRCDDPYYLSLLENHANWTHDVSIGWGYDDLVWSLIWWPERQHNAMTTTEKAHWCVPEVGAALLSQDHSLYALQMWDHTAPDYPTREHVNPNSLVLEAYGSPLTVDGVANKECTAFQYEDTWRELSNMTFTPIRSNFGLGCAGAHNVILVDGCESMHARQEYPQAQLLEFNTTIPSVTTDVTPLYREHWQDVRCIRRRTSLHDDRFWLIEDLASFAEAHDVTARWHLRPNLIGDCTGASIETAEGVRLNLRPIVGPDVKTTQFIAGYPDRIDGATVQVDFKQHGRQCRWLWLAWPEATRCHELECADEWQVVADAGDDFTAAAARVRVSSQRLPFTQPPFFLSDLPLARRWWYRRIIHTPQADRWWLQLPSLLFNTAVWVNGEQLDISDHIMRQRLLAPQITMPTYPAGTPIEVIVRCDCGIGQYGKENFEGSAFSGTPTIIVPDTVDTLRSAEYADGVVTVVSEHKRWQIDYSLLDDKVDGNE